MCAGSHTHEQVPGLQEWPETKPFPTASNGCSLESEKQEERDCLGGRTPDQSRGTYVKPGVATEPEAQFPPDLGSKTSKESRDLVRGSSPETRGHCSRSVDLQSALAGTVPTPSA